MPLLNPRTKQLLDDRNARAKQRATIRRIMEDPQQETMRQALNVVNQEYFGQSPVLNASLPSTFATVQGLMKNIDDEYEDRNTWAINELRATNQKIEDLLEELDTQQEILQTSSDIIAQQTCSDIIAQLRREIQECMDYRREVFEFVNTVIDRQRSASKQLVNQIYNTRRIDL
jgi:hypothetical protein